jgi:hypothetical protein
VSDLISNLKTSAAIAGSVVGLTGSAFALGSVIGRTPVEARLMAHLAPEVIHPEAAKRIEALEGEIREAQSSAQEAATESRLTRQALESFMDAERDRRPRGAK